MEAKGYNIHIDPFVDPLLLFSPVIAASLTGAFYSAVLLNQQKGESKSDDQLRNEVLGKWAFFSDAIRSSSLELKARRTSQEPPGELTPSLAGAKEP